MEPHHYKYINIVRGIAILMVISVHTSQHVSGFEGMLKTIASFGQMGVQLFFIASALTLCLSWEARKGNNCYSNFIIRRFFRIAPIYYFGMLFYFVMSCIDTMYLDGIFASNFKYNIENVLSNLLFTHGLVKTANNSVVPGGWSIGAEFAFYAAFPFLASLIFNGYRALAITMLIIASFIWATYNTSVKYTYTLNSFEYYTPLSQLVVFSFGIALHKIISIKARIRPIHLFAIALASTTLALLVFTNFRTGLAIWVNLTITSFSFCTIIMYIKQVSIKSNVLSNIGLVSYSMYINHFLIVWFILPYMTAFTSQHFESNINFLLMFTMTISLSYTMAKWTYKHIEMKFIDLGKRLIK
ncbi:acyltransferase [Aeromonas jandaei]|uniref:acyltransferase family protein n=1 Tax=Aeromonas jandaei TaxID=650 RepID=UPI00191CC4F6|nr:acyltransferase [Aeromonas jandaei]MBL0611864.1 acyltransferase [Aeromonas jandaei]